eukprot:CAMPEP_0173072462 /NCGR_PEP_ID=MMETSP1102-20130122/9835_1 /TAXON_ID=49646 /ORGANISM="Geminigera sp., Strain Caron Lab Isolate" /LENGTH=105 /DNA_ID=CAMNT_0013941143 /DNA_START=375 /DNA_END=689 /DNA_ORIENTATION=+
MIQRMESGMDMMPRMMNTVTRSESYSALDQIATTQTQLDDSIRYPKPVNLAGLSGKGSGHAQPAPTVQQATPLRPLRTMTPPAAEILKSWCSALRGPQPTARQFS